MSESSKEAMRVLEEGLRRDESAPSLQRPQTLLPHSAGSKSTGDLRELKKNLNLDFNSPNSVKKAGAITPELLSFLNLTSPELQKFITQGSVGGAVKTPTPTTALLFPQHVTHQQNEYARGFFDALTSIHKSNNFTPASNLLSPNGLVATPSESAAVAALLAATSSSASSFSSAAFAAVAAATTPQLPSPSTGSSLSSFGLSSSSEASLASSSKLHSPTHPEASIASLMQQVAASTFPGSPLASRTFYTTLMQNMMNHDSHQNMINQQSAAAALMKMRGKPEPHSEQAGCSSGFPSQGAPPRACSLSNLASAASSLFETPASYAGVSHLAPPPDHSRAPSAHSSNPSPCSFAMEPSAHHIDPFHHSGHLQLPTYNPTAGLPSSLHPPLSVKTEDDDSELGGPLSHASSHPSDDMRINPFANQEEAKLERKRHRNRVAASKCRKRKLDKIQTLELEVANRVRQKEGRESRLKELQDDVRRLRAELGAHHAAGCHLSSPKKKKL